MVGFFLFWFCSLPFLWIPPEKFRRPFQVICVYCGVNMICMCMSSFDLYAPIFSERALFSDLVALRRQRSRSYLLQKRSWFYKMVNLLAHAQVHQFSHRWQGCWYDKRLRLFALWKDCPWIYRWYGGVSVCYRHYG